MQRPDISNLVSPSTRKRAAIVGLIAGSLAALEFGEVGFIKGSRALYCSSGQQTDFCGHLERYDRDIARGARALREYGPSGLTIQYDR